MHERDAVGRRRSGNPERWADEHACPNPPLRSYANEGRPAEFNALCEGDLEFNGFYGYGIVDAYAAVTEKLELPD